MPGLRTIAGYRREDLRGDLAGGLSVAAIALPVGIAYADLAGVPTVVGIFSAIFPLFAYALFGSSRQLIVGPDTATCLIVAASLGPLAGGDPTRYASLLSLMTLMTAVILIAGGIARLGFMANFLSHPILTGYLNGVAIIIIVGQIPKLLGVSVDSNRILDTIAKTFENLGQADVPTFVLSATLVLLLLLMKRVAPSFPAPLLAVAGGFLAVTLFGLDGHGVAVLGEISLRSPSPGLPPADVDLWGTLFVDSSGIALVAFTSGVLTAKSFAQRNQYRVDANRELFGFGASNVASWLCGGFPVTGAGSRTSVSDAAGGRTQLVGIIAGISMLAVVFLLRDVLSLVPLAALAAVVFVAALSLLDLKALRLLYRMSRREFYISVSATIGVLLLGVLGGVLLAVSLSLLWLLAVTSRPRTSVLAQLPEKEGFHSISDHPEAETIPGLLIFRFDGNLIFFNAEYFVDSLERAIAASPDPVEWVIIEASPVNVIDATALQKFIGLRTEMGERGIRLVTARSKLASQAFFSQEFTDDLLKAGSGYRFDTLRAAVRAFFEREDGVCTESLETAANESECDDGHDRQSDH